MKSKKINKAFKSVFDEIKEADEKDGVVGYALFDTEKRAFVSFAHSYHKVTNVYASNVEDSYIADTRNEAFNTMISLSDYYDIRVVPLIRNELFGLTPKPGSLGEKYKFSKINDTSSDKK